MYQKEIKLFLNAYPDEDIAIKTVPPMTTGRPRMKKQATKQTVRADIKVSGSSALGDSYYRTLLKI